MLKLADSPKLRKHSHARTYDKWGFQPDAVSPRSPDRRTCVQCSDGIYPLYEVECQLQLRDREAHY